MFAPPEDRLGAVGYGSTRIGVRRSRRLTARQSPAPSSAPSGRSRSCGARRTGACVLRRPRALLAAEFVHTSSRLATRPGARRDPGPAAALPRRGARRRAQGRQARRGGIQAALQSGPGERRVVSRGAGAEPAGASACRSTGAPARTSATSRSVASRGAGRALVEHAPKMSIAPRRVFRQRYGREPRGRRARIADDQDPRLEEHRRPRSTSTTAWRASRRGVRAHQARRRGAVQRPQHRAARRRSICARSC